MDTKALQEKIKALNNFDGKDPFIVMECPENLAARTIEIKVSKSGIPCIYESGGSYVKTGWARIITSASGNTKRPLMIRTHGSLSCHDHALIALNVGSLIFEAKRTGIVYKLEDGKEQLETVVRVYRVESFDFHTKTANITPILYTGKRHPVIAAALKANHYHCRVPYYIRRDKPDSTANKNNSVLNQPPAELPTV